MFMFVVVETCLGRVAAQRASVSFLIQTALANYNGDVSKGDLHEVSAYMN